MRGIALLTKKTRRLVRERRAIYLADKLVSVTEIPEETFDAECSLCGRTFHLFGTVGTFGDREAEGIIFEGRPVCDDCFERKIRVI